MRISRRLLERNFRTVTGRTVLDFILDERFRRAKKMLKETVSPVESVCRFCGFRSPSHAMTIFRKRYGLTMTEYRLR